ncbi:MAG: hypothetical protein KGP12_09130 [Actinomycetales bacterium]|nr:hypothetical protein [Actinomycetales bacterium]
MSRKALPAATAAASPPGPESGDARDPGQGRQSGERLSRAWQRFGQPASLSLWVPVLYAPIGAIGPLLLDWNERGGSLVQWAGVAIAGELALLACFPALRRAVHGRDRLGQSRSRPGATLLSLYAATAVRAVVIAVAASLVVEPSARSGDLRDELLYRLLSAVLVQSGLLVVIALLVQAMTEHRSTVARLQDQRAWLEELDRTTQARLGAMHEQLVEQMRRTLDPQLDRLDATLEAVSHGADPSADVDDLVRFVEDELRPLSHQLTTVAPIDIDAPAPGTSGGRLRVRLPGRLSVSMALMPTLSAWLLFLGAIGGSYRNVQPDRRLAFILTLTIAMYAGLALLRWLLRGWDPRAHVTALVVIASSAAIAGLATWMQTLTPVAPEHRVIAAAAALGAAIGAAGFAYRWVRQGQLSAEEQLRGAVAALESRLNILRQNAWVMRRRLGYVMHGSVQGALYAAAMRLGSGQPLDASVIETIRRDVASAVARLDDIGPHGGTIEQVLADIETVWSGDCRVTWTVDRAALGSLEAHSATCECAAEIVREAVSNATHHGLAAAIDITVRQEAGRLVITVRDNGQRWDPSATPGLGSAMLDEMCLAWSRERSDGATTLTAVLAIPESAEARARRDQVMEAW